MSKIKLTPEMKRYVELRGKIDELTRSHGFLLTYVDLIAQKQGLNIDGVKKEALEIYNKNVQELIAQMMKKGNAA